VISNFLSVEERREGEREGGSGRVGEESRGAKGYIDDEESKTLDVLTNASLEEG